jgi:uncharacterized membrane protein YvbJ
MKLKKLKDKIEEIEITYDYENTYNNLYNTVIDYMNEAQDWDFEYLFEDYVSYDLAEDIAKNELESGGLVRLYYFLGDANLNNDIFRINGYGNLEDIDKDDLECLKDEILNIINNKLEEE